jgi:hypothetical protein
VGFVGFESARVGFTVELGRDQVGVSVELSLGQA